MLTPVERLGQLVIFDQCPGKKAWNYIGIKQFLPNIAFGFCHIDQHFFQTSILCLVLSEL